MKCYCNNCGKEQENKKGKCSYCSKSKIIKNKLFIDYLLDQTESDIKGNFLDKFIDKIKYFIKKYLYAIILSITVVGAFTINIAFHENVTIVHEKPVNFKKNLEYNDIDSLINDIKKFMDISDDLSIKNLLYQNYFKDEAKNLGINALDSVFFNHTKIGAYQKSYIEINVSENNEILPITKYCKSYQADCIENLGENDHKFFSMNFYIGFYWPNYNNQEHVFIGKDDFEFIIAKVDNKYYLVDIITYMSDPYIESVDGDSSKLDYDKQMRYYVDGIKE